VPNLQGGLDFYQIPFHQLLYCPHYCESDNIVKDIYTYNTSAPFQGTQSWVFWGRNSHNISDFQIFWPVLTEEISVMEICI
jgi:hypothetical protein